jgi:hypothetical protein
VQFRRYPRSCKVSEWQSAVAVTLPDLHTTVPPPAGWEGVRFKTKPEDLPYTFDFIRLSGEKPE